MADANTAVNTAKKLKREGRAAAFSPWMERLVRLGYAVQGTIYLGMGILAIEVILGAGGATTDQQGVIERVAAQPLGRPMMLFLALGLGGLSLWWLIATVYDPLHKGTDWSGLAIRLGYLVTAVSYGALTIPAARALAGYTSSVPGSEAGTSARTWTARLLASGWGRWLVLGIGLLTIASGVSLFVYALGKEYARDYQAYTLTGARKTWARRLGRVGVAAQGVLFALIGLFYVRAGWLVEASQVKGTSDALRELLQQPFGPGLLAAMALGLIAYGLHSFLTAWLFRLKS